jgi:hypothetical protein
MKNQNNTGAKLECFRFCPRHPFFVHVVSQSDAWTFFWDNPLPLACLMLRQIKIQLTKAFYLNPTI